MTKEKALFVDFKGKESWLIGFDTINGVYYIGRNEGSDFQSMVQVTQDVVFHYLKGAKDGGKYFSVVDSETLAKIQDEYGITGDLDL